MTLTTLLRTKARLNLAADTASDLMVPNPISLRATASATEAMRLFTAKGITAAPVIDESGRPVGVISRSDLLIHKRVQENSHDREFLREASIESVESEPEPCAPMTVQDLMTPAIFAVSENTAVSRVISDMVGLRVHRLFVVDENGTLVGIITTMDVLKHLNVAE